MCWRTFWSGNWFHFVGWLVVLGFNATLTGRVISWRSVTRVFWLSHTSSNTTFLSKATDYFSHMLLQRREAKICRKKKKSPQPGIKLATTRSWVRYAHHWATRAGRFHFVKSRNSQYLTLLWICFALTIMSCSSFSVGSWWWLTLFVSVLSFTSTVLPKDAPTTRGA